MTTLAATAAVSPRPERRRRRRPHLGRFLAHVALICTSLVILLPLLWIFRTSIVSRREAYLIPPNFAAALNLDSWSYILEDQNFTSFFVNSLAVSLPS